MGSWCTKLSNYMGGWCPRKSNSMGGWVKKKCRLPPPGDFSGIALTVKLLAEHHLEFLSLKEGCTGSSVYTHVKMPHC